MKMPTTRIPYGVLDGRYVNAEGDTMLGALTLSGAPTADLHAATKKYVDDGLALKADDADVLKKDGSTALTSDWDIGDARKILADGIRARDAAGLELYDDGGNGIFIEDGGNVGIGTTGPGRKLDVFDASNPQLRLTHTGGTKFADFQVDTDHTLTIKPSSTGQVIFQPTTNSTDFFQVLDADGGRPILNVDATYERLGVRTDSPSAPLHVWDDILAAPNANAHFDLYTAQIIQSGEGRLQFLANDSGNNAGSFIMTNVPASGDNKHWIMTHRGPNQGNLFQIGYEETSSSGLDIPAYADWRLTITPLGNVGIYTTSPDRRLEILDSSNPQLRLTHTDGSVYTDFQAESDGDLSIEPSGSNINIIDKNILLGTTTGMQIGTTTNQKLAIWGATPIVQESHIADPGGGATQDAEARTAIASILSSLEAFGLLATA